MHQGVVSQLQDTLLGPPWRLHASWGMNRSMCCVHILVKLERFHFPLVGWLVIPLS